MTTDKHDDGAVPEGSGHPPHLFYPPRTPRREIDWEKVDMRWMVDYTEDETRLSRFFGAIRDFLSRLKRRQPKAQATDEAHAVLTDDEIAKAAAECLALEQELQPSAAELAERRALDAAVRQELEQCSDADLDDIAQGPIFMFKADCDPEFRASVTTRQRVARELLAERAYQPGNVTIACPRDYRGSKSFRKRLRD